MNLDWPSLLLEQELHEQKILGNVLDRTMKEYLVLREKLVCKNIIDKQI